MLHSADTTPTPSRRSLVLGSVAALSLQACGSAPERPAADAVPPAPPRAGAALDLEAFVADCVAAARDAQPQDAVREVLARGVSDPAAMLAAVGPPERAGITTLHRSPTLTVFSAAWTPQMNVMPHDRIRPANLIWRQRLNARRSRAGGEPCPKSNPAPPVVVHRSSVRFWRSCPRAA